MIDPKFALAKNFRPVLPRMLEASSHNVKQLFNFIQVMQQMDGYQMLKGQTFFVVLVSLYAIQYCFVLVEVMIYGRTLEEMGILFVIYTFYNIAEMFIFFFTLLSIGASINDLDNDLKKALYRINKDVGRI
jgi:hypothetical protein